MKAINSDELFSSVDKYSLRCVGSPTPSHRHPAQSETHLSEEASSDFSMTLEISVSDTGDHQTCLIYTLSATSEVGGSFADYHAKA